MKIKFNFLKNWKNVFFIFIFYLSAHFLLLISKVIMWDGWLWTGFLKQKNYETLFQILNQAKLWHIYTLFRILDFISKGNPVAVSNVLVFISWLIAGISVYFILKNFTNMGRENIFFTVCLFLLSPIFIVRFEISVASYSLTNAAFFLGAYTFLQADKIAQLLQKIILQILATIFFIAAFFTASFLVFYGALILFSFYLFLQKESSATTKTYKWWINAALVFFKKKIIWILLPFIFYWMHQKFIGAPYGIYEGYNSFIFLNPKMSIMSVISILIDKTYQFIVYGFFEPIISAVSVLQRKIFLIIFLFFLACILFIEKKFTLLSSSDKNDSNNILLRPKNIFIWGMLLFIFGASAYILVGESPNPFGSGFDMRHGLILPLGSSLIILAIINGFLKNKIQRAAKIIILAVFITYNIYNYYTLDMDWYRQVGIIENIREKYNRGQIGEKDIFVFNNNLPGYAWKNRFVRDTEYSAYLYEATNNQKLIGANVDSDLNFMLTIKKDELNFNDKRTLERFKNIIITSNSNQVPTVKNWVKLKIADLFLEKNEMQLMIKSLVGVNLEISSQTSKEASRFDKLPSIQE